MKMSVWSVLNGVPGILSPVSISVAADVPFGRSPFQKIFIMTWTSRTMTRHVSTLTDDFYEFLEHASPQTVVRVEIRAKAIDKNTLDILLGRSITQKERNTPTINAIAITPVRHYLDKHSITSYDPRPKNRAVYATMPANMILDLAREPYISIILHDFSSEKN
jgi:hypothetical protein